MKNVLIVDYDMGNIDSIARAVEECGGKPIISNNLSDFKFASNIILPGVGSFSLAMKKINNLGLTDIIYEEVINNHKPMLGICLAMQLLASKGYEGGDTQGLNLIEGEVKLLIPKESNTKIPHIGWNNANFKSDSSLFIGMKSGWDFYFVHSYNFVCKNEQNILATTPYCGEFTSIVGKNNIFGTQFHPEKSQRAGFHLLRNFIAM